MSPTSVGLWVISVAVMGLDLAGSEPLRALKGNELQYLETPPGDPLDDAVFWPIPLADHAPEDVQLDVRFRGTVQRFGQVCYGTPNSRRVVIVVDEIDRDHFDFYVDATRSRRVTEKDRVPGEGRLRRTTLTTEVAREDQSPQHYSRGVVFRRGALGTAVGFATTGRLEGETTLRGRPIKVRRIDGDANGLFSDARDRVWIDRDSDGRWDPFSEQFPCLPILRLDGRRFALRSNLVGTEFSMDEIVGSGEVKLQVGTLPPDAQLTEFEVMLLGRDGSAFSARGQDEPISVPVGTYALHTVRLSLEQRSSGTRYNFVFSRDKSPNEDRWHDVGNGQRLILDPVGRLRLELHVLGRDDVAREPSVVVRPFLFAETGLTLNSSTVTPKSQSGAPQTRSVAANIALCSNGA